MTDTLSSLVWNAAPDPLGRPFLDLRPLTAALEARGWNPERLAKNGLPPATEGLDPGYVRFWETIEALCEAMNALQIPPVILKSIRVYAYDDGNVDLLVPAGRLWEVARALAKGRWKMPDTAYLIEQQLVERNKLKLLPREDTLLHAHLYEGIGWRYQSDLAILGARHDRVTAIDTRAFLPNGNGPGLRVFAPDPVAELVLQAAHIAFENYRMTVGEAVNLCLLRRQHAASWQAALTLADDVGCRHALVSLLEVAERIVADLDTLDPVATPLPLSKRLIFGIHLQRIAHLVRHGKIGGAIGELFSVAVVFPGVRTIRLLRRWRRGREDFR
jgi:hypothetical protein